MFTAPVADDGSFVLTLPSDPPQWQVAAYVSTSPTVCIFGCEWAAAPLGAVRSGVVIVDTSAPPSLTFSVSARVVDVFVRDGNGELVDDGGVQATDTRCPGSACPDGTTPMFVRATPSDGAVRLVVDPNVIYEFHGQAKNTGWSDPPYANDSGEFWFSPNETMLGADLEEGHVFTIEGAPSG